MSDYIERDKAIDKLRRRKALFCKNQIEFKLLPTNDKSRVDEIDACIAMLINMLPEDVQPVRWIPWDSGSFPDDSGTYIVTAYDGVKERVTFAKFQKRLKRWELTGTRAYWRVLAWMSLPEPWKGEDVEA